MNQIKRIVSVLAAVAMALALGGCTTYDNFRAAFIDKEPNMILIEAIKGGNPRVTVEKPLIVYKDKGVYTDEIYDIYGY